MGDKKYGQIIDGDADERAQSSVIAEAVQNQMGVGASVTGRTIASVRSEGSLVNSFGRFAFTFTDGSVLTFEGQVVGWQGPTGPGVPPGVYGVDVGAKELGP